MESANLFTAVNIAVTSLATFIVVRFAKSLLNEREIVKAQLSCLIAALSEMNGENRGFSENFKDNYDRHWRRAIEEKRFKYQ